MIGGLTVAQARALLKWHLVHERVAGTPFSVYQKLMDNGYLETSEAIVRKGGYLVVTPKGKEFCDKYHTEIPL